MATFTQVLRERDDDALVALLRLRPDLASPSPSTFASLAVRATSRAGLDRALARLDAASIGVLEAVVALGGATREQVRAAVVGPDAAGADLDVVDRALDDVLARALVWQDGATLQPAPGLATELGPYPAGLAPADPRVDDAAPADVIDALRDAPPGARAVLDALTWGTPVGRRPAPSTRADATVGWLVSRGLLAAVEGRRVVLPRPVSLALRSGRTHRGPARPPTLADGARALPADVVAAESAGAAGALVRLVGRLVAVWADPPAALRSGGLGVRDLRRAAGLLGVDEPTAAFVVELAVAAGLVAHEVTGPMPAFVPTTEADTWAATALPERWATLARAWFGTSRAPWLVGTKDERGSTRTALHPDGQRPWLPALRRAVLEALATTPPGAAPSTAQLLALLAWRSPRAVPPVDVVVAVLDEATRVGVLGAGALAPVGRVLLDPAGDLAAALADELPDPVDELLLQGDLTGIVPGRPTERLAELLDRASRVESRGGALTVRFTPDSVGEALDSGTDADELLGELTAFSRGPVPQALEYLVRDAARRRGRLRIGAAASYLRSEDPALLAALPGDPRFAGLGLSLVAPTVLVSTAPATELAAALRAADLAPVTEAPDGQVLDLSTAPRRARTRTHRPDPPRPVDAGLAGVVAHLRAADDGERLAEAGGPRPVASDLTDLPAPPTGASTHGAPAALPPGAGTSDPAEALLLLHEAAGDRREVWVEMVGPAGALQRRLLRPLRLDGGRLRALDTAREAELTIAVHRIASVAWPAPPGPPVPGAAPGDGTTQLEESM